jgi:hypothetical protein
MKTFLFAIGTVFFMPVLCVGQTSYPMITHAYPVAVQRGKTTEIVVQGQQGFPGAYKVLFEGEGVSAEILSPPTSPAGTTPAMRPQATGSLRLQVTVAPDATLGVREFRIATKLSLSSVGQLVIVDRPVTLEAADNNSPDKATLLSVPGAACGRLEALEDADFYKFHVTSGQTLTFEVFCARIQDKIHDLQQHADPVLFLYDAQGKELASNDDYRFADPLLSYHFDKGGDYFLQIRDAKYTGDARWVYLLSVTDKPVAAHVYPLAVAAGKSTAVDMISSHHGSLGQGKVAVPKEAAEGVALVPLQFQEETLHDIPVWVTSLPLVEEKEPNDTLARATPIKLPCCINGRIGTKRDLDHFVFQGKKGQALRLEVRARRFGTELVSLLDSNLDILDAQGRVLASGDDISPAIKDAQILFTPPQDGTYYLRIRDLHNKGGAQFVYAIEAVPVQPDFTLRVDGDKAMLGPGTSMPWYVLVQRQGGFTGPINIRVEGLPEGVTASPLTIPAELTQGVVVLTAAPSAKVDVRTVRVFGTAEMTIHGQKQQITKQAAAEQEIYFPGGGRGRFAVALQTVAVTETSDILQVEVTPKTLRLNPGEEVRVNVKLRRSPAAANANVTLDIPLRHLGTIYANPLPPGVVLVENKSKTLLGRSNEGYLTLRAAPNAAPVTKVPLAVVAHVSINFVVKIGYASLPLPLTVVGK